MSARGQRRRVAITGLGVKAPTGVTVDEAFDGMLSGRSTARRIAELAERGALVPIGCTVPAFDLSAYFTARELRQVDRATQLGVAASADAVADADLEQFTRDGGHRIGVAVGTGGSAISATEVLATRLLEGTGRIGANTVPMTMPSATAARISLRFGLRGPSLTYATACASGSTAIGEAMRAIRDGYADVMIAGGVDTCLTPMVMDSFAKVGALSRRVDDPSAASRPFDADRDGFVMAEGAAFMVLERWDHAVARGSRIYAELAGYGSGSEAHHIVAPLATGEAAAGCMLQALDDARIAVGEIGHITAHGTGTKANDLAESRAIAKIFHGYAPAVTATKGAVGHMIGGAGAFQAVISALSIQRGIVPPVANHTRITDVEEMNVVVGGPADIPSAPAICNSFGFGGHSACLVLAPA